MAVPAELFDTLLLFLAAILCVSSDCVRQLFEPEWVQGRPLTFNGSFRQDGVDACRIAGLICERAADCAPTSRILSRRIFTSLQTYGYRSYLPTRHSSMVIASNTLAGYLIKNYRQVLAAG